MSAEKVRRPNKQCMPKSVYCATDSMKNFRLLDWVLSKEGIVLEYRESAQWQDDDGDLERREPIRTAEETYKDAQKKLRGKATRNVTDAYEKISASYGKPQDCIVVVSELYVHFESLDKIVRVADKRTSRLSKLGDTPKNCEIRHCLAYIDNDAGTIQPRCFESAVKGTLASVPQGRIEDHHERQYVRFFIPEGFDGKTLAELSVKEYKQWFVRNSAYAKKFADWFNSGNKRTL